MTTVVTITAGYVCATPGDAREFATYLLVAEGFEATPITGGRVVVGHITVAKAIELAQIGIDRGHITPDVGQRTITDLEQMARSLAIATIPPDLADYVRWAVERALKYVDAGDEFTALTSFVQDMSQYGGAGHVAAVDLHSIARGFPHGRDEVEARMRGLGLPATRKPDTKTGPETRAEPGS